MARRNQSPEPMRRCIGCMQSKPKEELIRIAYFGGKLEADPEMKKEGRGCYICRGNESCREKALKKKGLNRAFKRGFSPEELEALGSELEALTKAGGEC